MSAPTATREDVVVIGGGAVGVCCAYFLARAGHSVLLLERETIGAAASWGNSGLLTTSACAPEAAPGVMLQALRWAARRHGAFRIRPRLDRAFLRWLRIFRAHCTDAAAVKATTYLRDRVRENTALIAELAHATESDFGFRDRGVLVLYRTERGLTEGRTGAGALAELGIASAHKTDAEVRQLEPRVTQSVVAGIHYPEDAHVDPAALVEHLAALARAHGARLVEQTPVVRLSGAHRIELVETAEGAFRPETVVVANGAWAPGLMRRVDAPLLIEAGKGFSVTYPVGSEVFARPLRLHEARTVVSSMGANVRLTSKLDLVGLDLRMREARARSAVEAARRYLAVPAGDGGGRVWSGLRPLSPDGLPYLGRSPRIGNLVLATGHGHLGISLCALSGRTVAQLVSGEAPPFDLNPLRPERFT
ncbi:MAG: FAD-dependent oxidoreductase [Gaiellales bacterium]